MLSRRQALMTCLTARKME